MTTPSLTAILAALTRSPKPDRVPLKHGLTLAYTPGDCNQAEPGVHRLTLSRRGVWPSEQEVATVKRDLSAALRAGGRVADGVCVEWWLEAKGNIKYHVLFWRELVQDNLL